MVTVSNATAIAFILLSVVVFVVPVTSFGPVSLVHNISQQSSSSRIEMIGDTAAAGDVMEKDHDHLYSPKQRDARYGGGLSSDLNVAKYLVDLHDAEATLDFCGGMMFQLVLSDQLRKYLVEITQTSPDENTKQLAVFDSSKARMFQIPEYEKSAKADNLRIFHGREIRKVTDAAGGMGMVLQLSLANTNGDGQDDPEGWTQDEIGDYDGWGHDVGRPWRTGEQLEKEGVLTHIKKFGPEAFGLHHRFYLHFDSSNKMWLSAEDGCEGTPAASGKKRGLFDFFNA